MEKDNKAPEQGLRYDTGKVRTDLVSPLAILAVARIYTKGARKYADHNWAKGMPWSKVIGPLLRHLLAFMCGCECDYDPACTSCVSNSCKNHTGELHVDQIVWNAMALSEYARTHTELDDRRKIPEDIVRKLLELL